MILVIYYLKICWGLFCGLRYDLSWRVFGVLQRREVFHMCTHPGTCPPWTAAFFKTAFPCDIIRSPSQFWRIWQPTQVLGKQLLITLHHMGIIRDGAMSQESMFQSWQNKKCWWGRADSHCLWKSYFTHMEDLHWGIFMGIFPENEIWQETRFE